MEMPPKKTVILSRPTGGLKMPKRLLVSSAKDGLFRFVLSQVPKCEGPGAPSSVQIERISISQRRPLVLKCVQALFLAIAVCFSVGATDAGVRYNDLGHRLMCTCGCAQMLGECNHVGCPASGPMLKELSAAISSGSTDKQILSSFSDKYGTTVLAAPPTEGFSLVAWIAPIAVFLAAFLGTILLVRHWSIGRTATLATQPADPVFAALRQKIRRETEASDL